MADEAARQNTTGEASEGQPLPPAVHNTYQGDADVVVQTHSFVGDIVHPGAGANPWPALLSYAVTLVLSAAAWLCGLFALDQLSSGTPSAVTWALTAGALICLYAAGLGLRRGRRRWRSYRAAGERQRLREAATLLADTTAAGWKKEEQARRLYDPKALPVRWHNGDPSLHDPWPVIHDKVENRPIPLGGQFADILQIFHSVPSQRLVVLGGPGSGKSILATRFVLDQLGSRSPTDRVAMLLPLSSWDTRTSFLDWVASRVRLACPQVADLGGTDMSVPLRDSGRLLLVLDGLDELPATARPRVIEALNHLRGGASGTVLLTSRQAEYQAALKAAGTKLRAAAVVELEPLDATDLRNFLPLTVDEGKDTAAVAGLVDAPVIDVTDTPATDDGGAAAPTTHTADHATVPDGTDGTGAAAPTTGAAGSKWQPLLDALPDSGTDAAPDPHGTMLSQALATPLMVALARAAYSDTDASPSELLDPEDFPDAETVEHHLLDRFVTAVFRTPPGADATTGVPAPRWTAAQAEQWLTALALRLQHLGLREITWWRLSPGVPGAARAGLEAFALALTLAVTGWLVFGQPPRPQEPPPPYVLAIQAVVCAIALLSRPFGAADAGTAPRRVVVRGRLRAFFTQAAIATAAVLPLGVPLGVTPAILVVLPLLFALRKFVDHAVDVSEAGSPRALLLADRRALILLAPVYALRGKDTDPRRPWLLVWAALGPVIVVTAWNHTGGRDAVGPLIWWISGLGSLMALALLGVAASAWWGFTATRTALAVTGTLPWALGAFLEDAHARGVLRQSGGVYEFRHARLQERLAGGAFTAPAEPHRSRLPPTTVNTAALPLALGALLVTSFTPGAAGPYSMASLYCPSLDLPSGYAAALDDTREAELYGCSWSGETTSEEAPLLKAGSFWGPPIYDHGYVGYYLLSVDVNVMRPQMSRSAVEVASKLYDEYRKDLGAPTDTPGLGEEAATASLSKVQVVTRTGNVVISTQVVDTRTKCQASRESVALAHTAETLRELGLDEDADPPLGETGPADCGAPADPEATPPPETPEPTPTPEPSPTPTEEKPDPPTELKIDDDEAELTHTCRGGTVEITGDDVVVMLLGHCGKVSLLGSRGRVTAQNTDSVLLGGDLNMIWCVEPPTEIDTYPAFEYDWYASTDLNCDPEDE
ncbi:NACHT domain-containing protein [Streptomyces sp. NPDC012510]|uniref:NACHT domain-containing protein n=1 Tax=Streptomyces sp. NPDC012510 TaxID=3364838 RepID=UPI0036EE2897